MEHYIYCITNLTNNKKYVGETKDYNRRFSQHKFYGEQGYQSLKKYNKGSFEKSGLYKDIKEIGIDNFKFEVLEICQYEDRLKREKFWIEKFDSYTNGYNDSPKHGASFINKKHSQKSKDKIGVANSGGNNGMAGKHHTLEARKSMGEKRKGKNNGFSHPVYCVFPNSIKMYFDCRIDMINYFKDKYDISAKPIVSLLKTGNGYNPRLEKHKCLKGLKCFYTDENK